MKFGFAKVCVDDRAATARTIWTLPLPETSGVDVGGCPLSEVGVHAKGDNQTERLEREPFLSLRLLLAVSVSAFYRRHLQ